MQVTVPDVCIEVAVAGGGVTGAASVPQRACFVRGVVGRGADACKQFQTETTYALLGKVRSADKADVRYLGIISKPLTWVQPVESHTA